MPLFSFSIGKGVATCSYLRRLSVYHKIKGVYAPFFFYNQIKRQLFYYIVDIRIMIQAITETNFSAYIQTEDNRIDTSVPSTHIRILMKFTNDMDGSIVYAYARTLFIYERYTRMNFIYSITPPVNMFTGQFSFTPSGYWKYEAYEVSWIDLPAAELNNTIAPAYETEVLPVLPTNGVVQGLVTKGKMYVKDLAGTEQVQYTQHPEPTANNYIYYGQ